MNQTPQVSEDLQKRVEGFNAELIPLLGKWKLGLGASAFLTEDGRTAARPQLFDDQKPAEVAQPAPETPAEAPAAPAPVAPAPAAEIVEG